MHAERDKTQAEMLTQGPQQDLLHLVQEALKEILGNIVTVENTCQAEVQKLRSEIRGQMEDLWIAANQQKVEDLPTAKLAELETEMQAMKVTWHSSYTAMTQDMRELMDKFQKATPLTQAMHLSTQLMEIRQELAKECSERKDSILSINAKLACVEPTAPQGVVQTASAGKTHPGHQKALDDMAELFAISSGINTPVAPRTRTNSGISTPSAAGTRTINGFGTSPSGSPRSSPRTPRVTLRSYESQRFPCSQTSAGNTGVFSPMHPYLDSSGSMSAKPLDLNQGIEPPDLKSLDLDQRISGFLDSGSRSARVPPSSARVAFSPENTSLMGGAGAARDIPIKDALYMPGSAALEEQCGSSDIVQIGVVLAKDPSESSGPMSAKPLDMYDFDIACQRILNQGSRSDRVLTCKERVGFSQEHISLMDGAGAARDIPIFTCKV